MHINKVFGPMVKILALMIKDVVLYLAFIATIFFVFCCVGQLLFQELAAFNSIVETSKYLFMTLMGNFDFTDFDNLDEVSPEVGYFYIVLYVITSAIMLLNFLIAILTNTHARYIKLERSLYLKEVILLIKQSKFNPYYSCIISVNPPFNLLLIPFMPVILCTRSKRVNNFFLYIEYSIVFVIAFICYSVFTALVIPLSYIYMVAIKLAKIFGGGYQGLTDIF